MQQSAAHLSPGRAAQHCAENLVDLVPHLAQRLRQGMRQGRDPELTVPQFRLLLACRNLPGAKLADLAELLGVSTATASRLVDALALRGLVDRAPAPGNRRRLRLDLSPAGVRVLDEALLTATDLFEDELRGLSPSDLAQLDAALGVMTRVFAPGARRRA